MFHTVLFSLLIYTSCLGPPFLVVPFLPSSLPRSPLGPAWLRVSGAGLVPPSSRPSPPQPLAHIGSRVERYSSGHRLVMVLLSPPFVPPLLNNYTAVRSFISSYFTSLPPVPSKPNTRATSLFSYVMSHE